MPAHATSRSLLNYSVADSSLAPPIRVAVVAMAVALTAVAAQFTMPIPGTSVPFVLTPLVVLLSGAALGSRAGCIAQALYLLAGALGVPVFAPSLLPPGVLRLFGPTGGYLLAYPVAAFATGWLAERGWDRRYLTSAAAMLIGLAIIFLGGVSWLSVSVTHSFQAAIVAGFVPFVGLDIIKVLVAAAILPRAWSAMGNTDPSPLSGRR